MQPKKKNKPTLGSLVFKRLGLGWCSGRFLGNDIPVFPWEGLSRSLGAPCICACFSPMSSSPTFYYLGFFRHPRASLEAKQSVVMVHEALQVLMWAPALALTPAGQNLLPFAAHGPCWERWDLGEQTLFLGFFFPPAVSFEVAKHQPWHCSACWRGPCRQPPLPQPALSPQIKENHKKQGGQEMPLPWGAPLQVPGRRWIRAWRWMSHPKTTVLNSHQQLHRLTWSLFEPTHKFGLHKVLQKVLIHCYRPAGMPLAPLYS